MQQITVNTDNFKRAISKLSHSFSAKSMLPALTHVYCSITANNIMMTTSDLELTGIISIEAESKSDFTFLMPFAQLNQIISVITSEQIVFEINKAKTKILSGFDEFELESTSKIEEYPCPKFEKFDSKISLDANAVAAIKSAACLLEKNIANLWINTVLLDPIDGNLKIVSTNRQSLILQKLDIQIEFQKPLLLPERVIKAMEDIQLPTTIDFNEKRLQVEQLNYKLSTPLIQSSFPPYNQIIPYHTVNINIDRDAFFNGIKKCSLVSDDLKTVNISIKNSEMHLSTNDENSKLKIQTKIDVENNGPDVSKSLLTLELLKVLGEARYKQLSLSLNEDSRMLVITTPEDENYLSLVVLKVA